MTACLQHTAALVVGLCSHGLAVSRALQRSGINVYAAEQNPQLPGAATNSIRQLFLVDSFADEQLIPALLDIRRQLAQYQQVVLFATNDNHVRCFGVHLQQLSTAFCISWADSCQAVLRLQKKSELEQIAQQNRLNYPKSAVLSTTDTLTQQLDGFRYPVIIKPVQPLSSFKTQLAANLNELSAQLAQYQADLPILAQEYIAGGDESLYFGALTMDHGKTVQAMVGRKLSSYPVARGQTTVAEVVQEPEVIALTEQFFAGFNLSGPVSLELKKAPDGSFWVIEPTVGRTDFWAELCIAAGFNQPLQEFQLALSQPVTVTALNMNISWFDAERAPLSYWQAVWQHKSLRPYGKRAAFTFWQRSDTAPFFRACRNLLKRLSRKHL
jgi:predicted ATP-grasp superfamily ATP-dependent carboligase